MQQNILSVNNVLQQTHTAMTWLLLPSCLFLTKVITFRHLFLLCNWDAQLQ